jgi:hypothetical protein
MKLIPSAAAALATALFTALPAAAQSAAVVLTPAGAPRIDVAGQVAWLGQHAISTDDWFGAGAFSLSGGYYVTPHIKVEGDFATAGRASFYSDEFIATPGAPYPVYRPLEHEVSLTTASGAVAYQLFENRWVHPFLAAGVEVAHTRDRTDVPPFVSYDPRGPAVPVPPAQTTTSYAVRPMVTGGFKFYIAPRAFVRTDLRWTFERSSAATVAWRGGIGIDF